MPAVHDTLHRLQETAYRINGKVLEVALACFEGESSTPGALRIADEYRDHEAIYFPHEVDSAGCIRPAANFLQPGDDFARGLLTFAVGLPVTRKSGGAGWLAVHLANAWGYNEEDLDARIAWVEEREDLWRRIAADPLNNREWAVADKPWQTLAAIFEWVGFLEHGFGFVSSLPVMVDGWRGSLPTYSVAPAGFVFELPEDVGAAVLRSLDASALMECVRLCKHEVRSIVVGHGAYGTHAAKAWLFTDLFREAARRSRVVLGRFPMGPTI